MLVVVSPYIHNNGREMILSGETKFWQIMKFSSVMPQYVKYWNVPSLQNRSFLIRYIKKYLDLVKPLGYGQATVTLCQCYIPAILTLGFQFLRNDINFFIFTFYVTNATMPNKIQLNYEKEQRDGNNLCYEKSLLKTAYLSWLRVKYN